MTHCYTNEVTGQMVGVKNENEVKNRMAHDHQLLLCGTSWLVLGC